MQQLGEQGKGQSLDAGILAMSGKVGKGLDFGQNLVSSSFLSFCSLYTWKMNAYAVCQPAAHLANWAHLSLWLQLGKAFG